MTNLLESHKFYFFAFTLILSFKENKGLKCYECDSSDLKCLFQLWTVEQIECAENVTHCYTEFEHSDAASSRLKRGCGKPERCSHETSQTCAACNTDNCNKHNICYYILCGPDHADCRSANFQLTGSRREVCHESDECISKLEMNANIIERRCKRAADVKTCSDQDVQCSTCNTPYCNNQKFLRCHNTKDVEQEYCYGNKCYEKIDNVTGVIARGCSSIESCLPEDYEICSSDDCNNSAIFFM